MKKLLTTILLIATISSCTIEGQEPVKTSNDRFNVELLFTVDGCKVYRFMDGRERYFTNCQGSASWSEKVGKSTYDVDISTNNK